MEIIAFEVPMDATYAALRADLEAAGQHIGGNDLLIAAQALTLDLCVVTANLREFERIKDLPVENWL